MKLVQPTVSLPLGIAEGEGAMTTAHLINQSINQSISIFTATCQVKYIYTSDEAWC